MRWPFKEYHTDDDNIEITYKEKIEEMVLINLKVINLIEKIKNIKHYIKEFRAYPLTVTIFT